MATLFQVLAAVCAALLTVSRPFMRTEDTRHKWMHTVVGVAGILCIVIAGLLNRSSQSDLTSKLSELQGGISTLGEKIGTSGDAAKILAETVKTLDRLNSRITSRRRGRGAAPAAPPRLLKARRSRPTKALA